MRPSPCRSGFTVLGLATLCALPPAAARAAAQATTTFPRAPSPEGAEFLLLPVGARATALGQAAAADAGSSEALFWNPAGLAHLPRGEFAIHHYESFFGSGDAAVFAIPSRRFGTVAVGAYLVDYGELAVTREELGPEPVGRISPRNVALLAAYATDVVGGFAAGIGYKLVQFRVDCSGDCRDVPTAVGTTHAVDFGLRFVLAGPLPLEVGASLRNIGFSLQVENRAQADPLPTRVQLGVRYGVVRPPLVGTGFDLRVLADLQGSVGDGKLAPVTLVGVESGVGDAVRLRAGYAFLDSEARGPSLGLGFRFGNVAIDLARVFHANDILGEKEPIHFSFRAVF